MKYSEALVMRKTAGWQDFDWGKFAKGNIGTIGGSILGTLLGGVFGGGKGALLGLLAGGLGGKGLEYFPQFWKGLNSLGIGKFTPNQHAYNTMMGANGYNVKPPSKLGEEHWYNPLSWRNDERNARRQQDYQNRMDRKRIKFAPQLGL